MVTVRLQLSCAAICRNATSMRAVRCCCVLLKRENLGEGLGYSQAWQGGIKLGAWHVGVSMVHVLWCLGEDDFKVSGSMYRSHSIVWTVKMEDSELKLLLKQKDLFFWFLLFQRKLANFCRIEIQKNNFRILQYFLLHS